ncbi:hypothetical protein PTKIN_Ptkin14bG0107400 [Pterospermum kingtungense]
MELGLNMAGKIYNNVTTTHEKMKDLKRKLEELNALKEDTEWRRSTELHPRKKLKKKVEIWFTNVERINGEILDLEQKVGESNAVSRGWGSLTENVLKKKQEVEELLQQGKFQDGLVVDNLGWIGQALSTTTVSGQAAKTCMEEIWAYLMDDGIEKIGVWGMGGIGKTTIMKLIHNQLLKEIEKFNIVIWVTVSKETNISIIQNIIAHAMNVKLHEVVDETIRAGMIHEQLARKGKYVLILDDLWDRLSLEEVGIPEPSKGSKLLVTTRSLDVCRFLACREVKVPTLSKPDAWELFLEKVGRDVLNHPDLLTIVESVAEECAGLPLAIVTIASCMRGERDIHVWRNALHDLKRQVKSVNGMEEKVFQKLQFSYDRLRDEKVKHCFLCCALYPEDHKIFEYELIQLWIAEGLVEEMDSMDMEIDKGYTILNDLKNSCLIENAANGGVKLHDVVRDMALRITSVRPRFLVRAGMQLKEIPDVQHWKEDLQKASLMENWQLQIPPEMPPPRCPNLTTLLLPRCGIESIPEGFFELMHGLKILDLSYNHGIKSLPNSISNLETLTALLICGCERLEKVPSFSKLEALKKLDLSGTGIEYIPDGMEKLVNLKYLDLSESRITEMDDGILTKLTSLQQLKLTEGLGISVREVTVRGEVIGGLRKLEIFEGKFHDLNELNNYGQALQLAQTSGLCDYRILVGPEAYIDPDSDCNKAIDINGDVIYCTHGIKIPSDVQHLGIRNITVGLCEEKDALFFSGFIIPVPHNIFSSLAVIDISECKNIKKLFSSKWVLHSLQNLKYLTIRDCDEMEEMIASESEITSSATASASFKFTVTLPKLQELFLWNLSELQSLCGANVQLVCDSIKKIVIGNCPKIKRIPLKLPLQDDGQPSPPPSFGYILVCPEEWWEMVEWDHPNAKSLLQPYLEFEW